MDKKYDENTILGKYVKSCEIMGEPLSEVQLENLEKIICTSFGVSAPERLEDSRVIGEIDEDLIHKIAQKGHGRLTATRLLNIIKEFKKNASEKDLLNIYHKGKGYADISCRTPRGMGNSSFNLLKDYLEIRGIVPVE